MGGRKRKTLSLSLSIYTNKTSEGSLLANQAS